MLAEENGFFISFGANPWEKRSCPRWGIHGNFREKCNWNNDSQDDISRRQGDGYKILSVHSSVGLELFWAMHWLVLSFCVELRW